MSYRIRIIGGSGTGKSTMAKMLGQLLNIDTVIHIDDIFWLPGWQMTDYDVLAEQLLAIASDHESWIMDGNYTRSGKALFDHATHVIIM